MNRSVRHYLLLLAIATTVTAICGCNSLKQTWDRRGVPAQWEPDSATPSPNER
jgi:hypothetical protein